MLPPKNKMAKEIFKSIHLPFPRNSQDFQNIFWSKKTRGWAQGIWEGAKRPKLGIIQEKSLTK